MKQAGILLLLLLYSIITWGQKGTIQGTIIDARSNDPLIGATIKILNTEIGTVTDIDGFFSIDRIEPGIYNLEISYLSFKTESINKVTVEAGKVTQINYGLAEESKTLDEVVVTADKVRNNEVAILSEIKTSMQVVSGISEQQIKKSLDGNAAQIVRRVPGITIIGDRFINIRGLNSRYNNVMLHNAFTPSMETDVKSFSFDIIPANQIERMLIFKSPSADLPGDFAGGVVKIFTKGIPDQTGMTIDYSTSVRQGTTFNDFFQPELGKNYWTGFNNKYNALPSRFPASINNVINNNIALELAGKSLKNNWIANRSQAIPDQKIDVTANNRFHIGSWIVGNSTAITYNDSRSNFNINRGDFNEQYQGQESKIYNYQDHQYNRNIRVGVMHNWAFKMPNGNQIEWKNLFNQNSTGSYVYRGGNNFESNYIPNNHSFDQVYKNIYSSQLTGTHVAKNHGLTIDWTIGYNRSSREQPDYRRYRSDFDSGDGSSSIYVPFGAAQAFFLGRFSSHMLEKAYSGNLNITKQLGDHQLKFGGMYEDKGRDFAARNLGYVRGTSSDFDFNLLNGSITNLFNNINNRSGIKIDEQTNPSDSYHSANKLAAGYVTLMTPLGNKVAINTGVRFENNVQTLESALIGGESINLKYPISKLLPSANINYNITTKTVLKGSYGMTLNRPEFRELAPFAYYDFDYNYVYKGSPLRTAVVQNFDARIENYPTPNEVISAAVFYKHFKDPIESLVVPGAGSGGAKTFTFGNAKSSESYGVEVEIKKSLYHLTNSAFLNNISTILNATFIRSKVHLGSISTGQSDNRPLQGQSPYIINAGLSYNDINHKFQVNALYNVIGKRIFAVGFDGYPDLYEMPRNVLDLSFTKELTTRLSLKAGVSDILNAAARILQDGNQDGKFDPKSDQTIQYYRPGRVAQIGLSFRLY